MTELDGDSSPFPSVRNSTTESTDFLVSSVSKLLRFLFFGFLDSAFNLCFISIQFLQMNVIFR